MFKYRMKGTVALLFALLMLCSGVLFATSHSGGKHKLVIQVSSGDQQTQTIALNNAVNLQRELGPDNIAIEIVAYGPGLSLLTDKSTQKQRVESLAMQEITFSACGNTMKKVEKKSGKKPVLIEGVQVVPAGVLRIMQLQDEFELVALDYCVTFEVSPPAWQDARCRYRSATIAGELRVAGDDEDNDDGHTGSQPGFAPVRSRGPRSTSSSVALGATSTTARGE